MPDRTEEEINEELNDIVDTIVNLNIKVSVNDERISALESEIRSNEMNRQIEAIRTPDTTEPLQDENGFCIKCPYNFVKRLEPFVDAMEWIPQFLKDFIDEYADAYAESKGMNFKWNFYATKIREFLAELGGDHP